MPTLEGITLGRYRLIRPLGQGGMAQVYLAADDQLHRQVALKVVHLSQQEDLARFHQEAELLGSLTHEHIVPVFDSGVQGPWHYLVMPYLPEGTLRDRLTTKGPLSQEGAGLLLDQIASALYYAHERGILHRDLKPSNILLRDEGFAYVADFGLAKALSEARELTQTGVVMGTPEYLAPELLEQPASTSSEVYALGVLLYQTLTGQLPFTGKSALAIIQQQVNTPPVPLSHLTPAISWPVEQVVLRALSKDPARRFPTPLALAQAYRQALVEPAVPLPRSPTQRFPRGSYSFASPTVATPPATRSPASRRAARPGPRVLLISGVLGGLVLLAVAFWLGATLHGPGPAAPAQTPVTSVGAIPPPTLLPSPTPIPSPTQIPSPTATFTPCAVTDGAGVLTQAQVCQAVHLLASPVTVYTTSTFTQGDADFDRLAQTLVSSPSMIVIAIKVQPQAGPGPPHVHVMIVGGISVSLTDTQYHQAITSFNQAVQTGDLTQATIDAIQTLHTEGA